MAADAKVRSAAQEERNRLQAICSAADFALAAVSLIAASTSQLVFGAVGLVPAAPRWRAQREMQAQQRLIEDPPRDDFDRPVDAPMEVWRPITPIDDLGPIGESIAAYIFFSSRLVAVQEAMIEAHEKQLGAELKGASDLALDRGLEVEHFARMVSADLYRTAGLMQELMKQLMVGRFDEVDSQIAELLFGEQRLADKEMPIIALPQHLIAELFWFDIPSHSVDDWKNPREVSLEYKAFGQLASALELDAYSKRALAEALIPGAAQRV